MSQCRSQEGKKTEQSTHVADPDDLVGGGVRADLAGEVDVAALGYAARVDVGAEGQDRPRRICKKGEGSDEKLSRDGRRLCYHAVSWRLVCKGHKLNGTRNSSVKRKS